MDFGCILEPKFDDFGSQNGIKKALKNQSNFGGDFGRKSSTDEAGDAEILCPRRNARGAWILNLHRIRPNSFSHALLPQRGAADSIEDPPKGGAPPPHFLF